MKTVWANACVDITVEISELLGAETNIYTSVDGDPIIAAVPSRDDLTPGQPLKLWFDMNHCHLFDADTEELISEKTEMKKDSDDDFDI